MASSLNLCIAMLAYALIILPAFSYTAVTLPKTFLKSAHEKGSMLPHGRRQSTVLMAGFGGGPKSKKKTKKDAPPTPLKAKQQWDRYEGLKGTTKHTVGVRVDGSEDWMKVGFVRSKGDAFPEYAVSRQRALIASHARRLSPLTVSPKSSMEWGMFVDDEWQSISKNEGNRDDISEKDVGFEGYCDPNTGYYCHYKDGKIVSQLSG